MRRKKRHTTSSFADTFWDFLRDNPELARMIAFELGSLAGTVVQNFAGSKRSLKHQVKKVPQALIEALPQSLSDALKFLPAPKLQPAKRTPPKRSAARKTKHTA